MIQTLMYRALMGREADVIAGFTSDGRIAASDLVVFGDPRNAIPPYDAFLFVTGARTSNARPLEALTPLVGFISIKRMRADYFAIDRDGDKLTPAPAARMIAENQLATPTGRPHPDGAR